MGGGGGEKIKARSVLTWAIFNNPERTAGGENYQHGGCDKEELPRKGASFTGKQAPPDKNPPAAKEAQGLASDRAMNRKTQLHKCRRFIQPWGKEVKKGIRK